MPEPPPETAGAQVRRRRRALSGESGNRELSQKELAQVAGVSIETIGNVEKDASPNPATLPGIRHALARLEAEQHVGGPVAPEIDPQVASVLAGLVPYIVRTRYLADGVVELYVIARAVSVTDERLAEIVREIDAR